MSHMKIGLPKFSHDGKWRRELAITASLGATVVDDAAGTLKPPPLMVGLFLKWAWPPLSFHWIRNCAPLRRVEG